MKYYVCKIKIHDTIHWEKSAIYKIIEDENMNFIEKVLLDSTTTDLDTFEEGLRKLIKFVGDQTVKGMLYRFGDYLYNFSFIETIECEDENSAKLFMKMKELEYNAKE